MIEIILMIVVVLFLLSKLNSLLGSENEEKFFSENQNLNNLKEKIISIQQHATTNAFKDFEYLSPIDKRNFEEILKINSNITPKNFLEIAKDVILLVFENYSKNDYESLKNLLSQEIYDTLLNNDSHKDEKIEILNIKNEKISSVEIRNGFYMIKIAIDLHEVIYFKDEKSNQFSQEIWAFSTESLSSAWKVVSIEKID